MSADFEEEGLWGLLVVLHFLGFFCVGEIIIIGYYYSTTFMEICIYMNINIQINQLSN